MLQSSRGNSKGVNGLMGFGGAVAGVRRISGGESSGKRHLLDGFGCDSRTRQCWRKSSFGFTAICPVNGGRACDERSIRPIALCRNGLGDRVHSRAPRCTRGNPPGFCRWAIVPCDLSGKSRFRAEPSVSRAMFIFPRVSPKSGSAASVPLAAGFAPGFQTAHTPRASQSRTLGPRDSR